MVTAAQSKLIQAELAPAALGAQISSAIAVKSQNAEKQTGAAVLKLLDSDTQAQNAPTPNDLGGSLDISA